MSKAEVPLTCPDCGRHVDTLGRNFTVRTLRWAPRHRGDGGPQPEDSAMVHINCPKQSDAPAAALCGPYSDRERLARQQPGRVTKWR